MQLPSVQIDAVRETTETLFVANRNPQPDEVQVPGAASIEFDVFGATTSLEIVINDIDVYAAGAFDNGWTGSFVPGSVTGVTAAQLVPPEAFTSGQRVRVEVYQGNRARAAIWSYFVYDLTPPLLDVVQGITADQIRVVFNEAVDMTTALVAANYYVERVSRPAVRPAVTRVEYVADNEVILHLDLEMSFGADYMLVVSDATDEFGNPFLAPDNVKAFTGWLPPYPAGRRWLLHDFVPRMMLAEDISGDLVMFLACLQDANNLLLYYADKWIELIDPDTAPEAFVDAMLVDLGNPFEFQLTTVEKRRLAKTLMLIYQLKGTAVGVADVVRFFLSIEVSIETFVGRGWRLGYDQVSSTGRLAPKPAIIGPSSRGNYSFRVLAARPLTETERLQIWNLALYMKGAQEHLSSVRDITADALEYRFWRYDRINRTWTQLGSPSVPPDPPGTSKNITAFVLHTP